MKVALIFLTLFVAYSRQQYRQRMMGPWILPIQLPTHNQLLLDNRYFDQFNTLQEEPRLELMSRNQLITEEKALPHYQSRNKGFGYRQRPAFLDQQNARFFGFSSIPFANPILKTSISTITSTCTDFTFVTCIPAVMLALLSPCRRKRLTDSADLFDDDGQFPVVPSQVQSVEPTTIEQLRPAVSRDSRQSSIDIISSKEKQSINEPNINILVEKMLRNGRFLWRDVTLVTTLTSWSTTLSTRTSTFVPINPAAPLEGILLPCLPSGYQVC